MNSIVQTASPIPASRARGEASHLWVLALILVAIVGGALFTARNQGPVDPDAIASIVGP